MIEVNNLTKTRVDKRAFSTVAKIVLKGENRETETLSLAFVGKSEMQKINKKYRGKNKPTDVLSFGEDSGYKMPNSEFKYLGEIVICPDVVKENAIKYNSNFKTEIIKVFIHGILHLCGYDHEKTKKQAEIMEQKEKKYFSAL